MTLTLKQLSALACAATLATFTGLASAQHGHSDGHFEATDHDRFQQHYKADANKWAGKQNRPHFQEGQAVPKNYRFQPVPRSYWGKTPPPAGYTYGYYDGYVVSYNPATRIVADVLDLATGH